MDLTTILGRRAKAKDATVGALVLPALQGTPKQLAWASKIRDGLLEKIKTTLADNPAFNLLRVEAVRVLALLRRESQAKWLIESGRNELATIADWQSLVTQTKYSHEWTAEELQTLERELGIDQVERHLSRLLLLGVDDATLQWRVRHFGIEKVEGELHGRLVFDLAGDKTPKPPKGAPLTDEEQARLDEEVAKLRSLLNPAPALSEQS